MPAPNRDGAVLRAMTLMLISTALLSVMHALVRYTSATVHPFEIAFFRNLFGLAAIVPLVVRAGRAGLVTSQPKMHALRGVLGAVAMLGWFYGLSVVPIATATALSFTAAIFAALGAVILLGERLRLRRWSAIIVGFIGALIILRPGFAALDWGIVMILVSALCWGTNMVLVKQLARTDSTVSIVAWVSIILTVISFFPALWVWRWPTTAELCWLFVLGSFGTGGHICMVSALKLADATSLLPLDFSRLLWASLLGYWAFAEVPDGWTWLGGTVIFASSAYIMYREARLKRGSQ